jgi:hypothetical protein
MRKKDLIMDDVSFSKVKKAKKEEYPIYGILYESPKGTAFTATVAAKSGEEAISLLEGALEDRDDLNWRLNNNPIAKKTEFVTNKKGVIFGYDSFSDNFL